MSTFPRFKKLFVLPAIVLAGFFISVPNSFSAEKGTLPIMGNMESGSPEMLWPGMGPGYFPHLMSPDPGMDAHFMICNQSSGFSPNDTLLFGGKGTVKRKTTVKNAQYIVSVTLLSPDSSIDNVGSARAISPNGKLVYCGTQNVSYIKEIEYIATDAGGESKIVNPGIVQSGAVIQVDVDKNNPKLFHYRIYVREMVRLVTMKHGVQNPILRTRLNTSGDGLLDKEGSATLILGNGYKLSVKVSHIR